MSDTSVLIVLVGAATKCRKHIDWEISAALSKKVGGYSGFMALCIEGNPDYPSPHYSSLNIPKRLADNLTSGYAKYYDWTTSKESISRWVEDAFNARLDRQELIDNSHLQMTEDECE